MGRGSKGRGYRTFDCQGWTILVGKAATDNDRLTLDIADPRDFWLHVSGYSGSHVVVRNPDDLPEAPRDVVDYAARLAAWYSKARGSRGKVEVHLCRAGDVSKPRGFEPGKVLLARWTALKVYAKDPPDGVDT